MPTGCCKVLLLDTVKVLLVCSWHSRDTKYMSFFGSDTLSFNNFTEMYLAPQLGLIEQTNEGNWWILYFIITRFVNYFGPFGSITCIANIARDRAVPNSPLPALPATDTRTPLVNNSVKKSFLIRYIIILVCLCYLFLGFDGYKRQENGTQKKDPIRGGEIGRNNYFSQRKTSKLKSWYD